MGLWVLTLDQASKVLLANILGYASIGCWLCAQFPQVLKNASLRSCEGLALPFLVNWMFGDMTNLVGCVLTDQLPFQTYLAGYFCIVDFALLAQFFYYRAPPTPSAPPPTPRYLSYNSLVASPRQSMILPPQSAPPTISGRTRTSSGTILPASATSRPRPKRSHYTTAGQYLPPDINVTSPPIDAPYSAIYEAALDVARAAERASQRRSHSRARRMTSRHYSNTNQPTSSGGAAETEGEEDMMESFHSDMTGKTSKSSTRASSPKSGAARLTQSTGTLLDLGDRGRPRSRVRGNLPTPPDGENVDEVDGIEGLPRQGHGHVLGFQHGAGGENKEHQRSKSRSLSLVRGSGGRGGRRAAGVAFMSLGLLVGSGGWNTSSASFGKIGGSSTTGVVLATPSPTPASVWTIPRHPLPLSHSASAASPPHLDYRNSTYILELDHVPDHDHDKDSHPPDYTPSIERIIGRISAWTCTTLYLTSRLPQIWKNFQRKSVEGLSIMLFVMAFGGNITYVASILLNPAGGADPVEASHYLLEALPYLLGSGGTLIFDLTIMVQSLIYGSAPPLPMHPTQSDRGSRRRHLSSRKRLRHLEEGGSYSGSAERTPLLPPGNIMATPHFSERNLSPEADTRVASSARGKRTASVGRGGGAGMTSVSPVRAALVV
ncbi:hypothetical protein IAR55_000310 [Kwoniella newhampshirensis]|uniref:Vacuolar membrane protein n=1 Tax=Kwoniella newhampshirensis TaxID=1651941 RepID=A0AAW0Z6A0_9TREE